MAKIALVIMLFSLVIAMSAVQIARAEQGDDWPEKVIGGKEKITRLHFYFHNIISGKNPTAVRVAQAPDTDKSPTLFGAVVMVDDPLTEGSELNSKLVGRAQGLFGCAGQEDFSLIMVMSFAFTDGIYNGSTLSILGRNPESHPVREMPIVGGTGMFRLARGIALAKTFRSDASNAIVEYNVTAIHY